VLRPRAAGGRETIEVRNMTDKDPKAATPNVVSTNQPKLRYQDLPELPETFSDSIRSCVFDGQMMRIEFTVTRFDDRSTAGVVEGRQLPVCRLVLTRNTLLDLVNRISQMGEALKKSGVPGIKMPEPGTRN
jgi:hypothetical protein